MHAAPPKSELKENVGAAANRRANADPARQFGKEIVNAKEELPTVASLGCLELRPQAPDLQLCKPYTTEILRYLLESEQRGGPSRDYIAQHPHINAHMRAVLVDWVVDVTQKFKLQSQCAFLAVNLLDRFLVLEQPERNRLQLVGVSCLMIVAKYEEIYPPPLTDYVAVCDNAYKAEELLATESAVLAATLFELNRPTPLTFLECFHAFFALPQKPLHYCHYLLESALLDLAHLEHSASELAAGAFFLICKLFKDCHWTDEHERVSGIAAARAKTCARDLYLIMQRNERAKLTAVKRKFAAPRFSEVARFRIEKVSQD